MEDLSVVLPADATLVGMYLLISTTALYRFSLYVDWSVPLMVFQCLSSLREKGAGSTDSHATELEESPVVADYS